MYKLPLLDSRILYIRCFKCNRNSIIDQNSIIFTFWTIKANTYGGSSERFQNTRRFAFFHGLKDRLFVILRITTKNHKIHKRSQETTTYIDQFLHLSHHSMNKSLTVKNKKIQIYNTRRQSWQEVIQISIGQKVGSIFDRPT